MGYNFPAFLILREQEVQNYSLLPVMSREGYLLFIKTQEVTGLLLHLKLMLT